MVILFLVLVIIISFVLGFIVLVQNPKGGGLAGNIAGFSNQFMVSLGATIMFLYLLPKLKQQPTEEEGADG